jgi:5-formyltetrahydrofolate cyclo-ligase
VTDFSDLDREKASARADRLATRRRMTPAERAAGDAAVRAGLIALARDRRARTIASYVPMTGEPGGPDLPSALARALPDAVLLLPVLRPDNDLDWARYRGDGALVTSGRGLREPAGPRLGRTAIGAADLVVVPALAVDRSGIRLGRGGGSYDRALARVARDTPVVAVLYAGEFVDALPAGPCDRPVGAVVDPSGLVGTALGWTNGPPMTDY